VLPSERIKQLVEDAKIPYAELEKQTGIAKSSLQRYASGETKKIPIDAVEKLAPALGVTAAYIMGWEDKETASSVKKQEEALREYFLAKIGREPNDEELKRLDDFADTFIKGLDKTIDRGAKSE